MITIGNKKVKIIKSRVLKNGAVGAYVRYPDKSVKWRIIGKTNSISGGYNSFPNKSSANFSFSGPAYRTKKQKLKALGIKPNRLKVKNKNIKNLISNKTNKKCIKTADQKKYEYTKTQSDSFSNNNLFGMQYLCDLVPGCKKFRSSVELKCPPANYRTNASIYDFKKRGFDISNTSVSYKNIKNLIANKK